MPMVLIEFFWPERYLLPCLLESLSQPLWIGMSIEIWINPQNPYDFRISGQKYKNFSLTMCDRTGGNADFTFFHDFYTKIGEYKEKKFVKYEGLYRIFLRDTIFEEER